MNFFLILDRIVFNYDLVILSLFVQNIVSNYKHSQNRNDAVLDYFGATRG